MELFHTNSWLDRGEEKRKQHREKRRQDSLSIKERKEQREEMKHWERIEYEKSQSALIDAELEKFTSRPEQELQKITTRLATTNFDSIRDDLYSEDEIYQSLSEVIADGYNILTFLGVGFNRAAFLISTPNGQKLVAKIPIRDYGFSDNRTEVYLSRKSHMNTDGNVLARTEQTARDMYVLQEACKPIPWDHINASRQQLIENAAKKMGFDDIQAGISLEDGEVKVYDFAYPRDVYL